MSIPPCSFLVNREETILEHPIYQFKHRRAFYRAHVSYRNGKKNMPKVGYITTLQRAIDFRLKDPWDKPGTVNPLLLKGLSDVLAFDGDRCVQDGKIHPLLAEL